jgi:hypothetical protein
VYTYDATADSSGRFQTPGGAGFSVEPDLRPMTAAQGQTLWTVAGAWALRVDRGQRGVLPLIVTTSRVQFFREPFERLDFSGADAGSRWLVHLFEAGEVVIPPLNPQPQVDLLFLKTSWSPSELALGTYYFGSDGSVSSASDVSVPAFDVRAYKAVYFSMRSDGTTGSAGGNQIDAGFWGYDSPAWGSGATANQNCLTLATSQNYNTVVQGDCAAGEGVAFSSGRYTPQRVPFVRPRLASFTGTAPSALVAAMRMVLFGVRG